MKNQAGSALIMVLMILLVITVVGIMAIRSGLTSLNIATNAQINSLLFQTSDAAYREFERVFALGKGGAISGIGYATLAGNQGKEINFCFRPKSNDLLAGNIFKSTILVAGTTDDAAMEGADGGGLCDLTASTDFISGRDAVMTQLTVVMPLDKAAESRPFDLAPKKTSTITAKIEDVKRVRVFATSILPGLANSDLTTVQNACMKKRIIDDLDVEKSSKETLPDCLARYGIPYKSQVHEYQLTTLITQTAIS